MAEYYTVTGNPGTSTPGSSSEIRTEFLAIQAGFDDNLPTLAGNGSEIVVVNSGGTGLETTPILNVARGGSGAATLTDGGVLLGSGTGAFTAMAVLADSEMIVGNGATDPVAESGGTLRTSIGVGTGDSPTFSGLTLSTTPLAVASGGIGVGTLTNGGVLLGSGTGAITALAVLADGEMIVGDGTTDPAIESGATLRTSIGVGTGDNVEFAATTITTLTASGVVSVDDVTQSTSTTTGSIHTDGGLGVVLDSFLGGNLQVTGKIGINTAPTQALHIEGSGDRQILINSTTARAQLALNGIKTGSDGEFAEISMANNSDSVAGILFLRDGADDAGAVDIATQATGGGVTSAMRIKGSGNIGMGGVTVPLARVHIDQSGSTAAIPVLTLDQGDINDTFINYLGSTAADGSRSISSDTTEDSAKFGAFRVEINGVTKWVRVYDTHS